MFPLSPNNQGQKGLNFFVETQKENQKSQFLLLAKQVAGYCSHRRRHSNAGQRVWKLDILQSCSIFKRIVLNACHKLGDHHLSCPVPRPHKVSTLLSRNPRDPKPSYYRATSRSIRHSGKVSSRMCAVPSGISTKTTASSEPGFRL